MKPYSESELVQKPIIDFMQNSLGWESYYAFSETFGEAGSLGRANDKEVLLKKFLIPAMQRLNPDIPEDALLSAYKKLTETGVGRSLEQINLENYRYLLEGVPVEFKDVNNKFTKRFVKIIDFNVPENNHFLVVREFWIQGVLYRRRADIVVFVNGIPLVLMECKSPNEPVRSALEDNIKDYKVSVPQLFYHNAWIVLSNGIQSKIGSLTAKYGHFHEWKRLTEKEAGDLSLNTLLKGVFQKETFLDILENFIVFDESAGKVVKILAKNHQYMGVNQAFDSVKHRKAKDGKLGVFWHTQGSGKSYSMVFFTKKVQRKIGRNFTFVICTDRDDLDTQIYKTFAGVGLVNQDKDPCRADSGESLKKLLQEHKSFVFTLIQKFNQQLRPNEFYNQREDIIVITDEAHRTQYGVFALNLRNALPNASYIGFTGTPLFKEDEITRQVFGDYVSTYDFQRAIEDGATVPLYFDARGESLDLTAKNLNEKIASKLEEWTDNLDEMLKLERELARNYHIITATKRLESIAIDFVEHYSKAWESGKAMFVCIDKLTCVRMYDLITKQWGEQKKVIHNKIQSSRDDEEKNYLRKQLAWMDETKMAVVVSEELNEQIKFENWNLDITQHRRLMKEGFLLENGKRMDIETAFKNPEHPFRIVFVCAMWLTGFDVPCLSTLYLDKPLKAHSLMQAIARANRVYEGKVNGLIVDYIGILKNLRDALVTFTVSGDRLGEPPTPPQDELLERLKEAYLIIQEFLSKRGFRLESLGHLKGKLLLEKISQAKEAINEDSESRRRFGIMAREFFKLFKACINHRKVNEYRDIYNAINIIYKNLEEDKEKADIDAVLKDLQEIVNKSVGTLIANSPKSNKFDISKIDFQLLQEKFKKSKTKRTTVQNLMDAIEKKLHTMLKQNPKRMNFQEKYKEMIDAYNLEKDRKTIEETFQQILEFIEDLDKESHRAENEGMTEEALAIYDALLKEDLLPDEKTKVKTVSFSLQKELNSFLQEIHNWKEKSTTRDSLKSKIRDFLWGDHTGLPPSYSEEEIAQKTEEIFTLLLIPQW